MNLSPRTVKFLRNKGFDAHRVNELLGEGTIEDETIFNYALTNGFVIVTSDFDFGEILALTKNQLPSVIVLRQSDRRVETVNQTLEKTLGDIEPELLEGSIVVIENHRIRIRKLPIS